MLDREAAGVFFKQINEMWIEQEVEKRRKSGALPEKFSIKQCLIRLPSDKPPIVEFNEEIGFEAMVRPAGGKEFVKGENVYLHDVQSIETVQPPQVDGQRVAFVYLFWNGKNYSIVFDFSPNVPEEYISQEEKKNWILGQRIASSLQLILEEKAVLAQDEMQDELRKAGLWAAPALIPYPLTRIVMHLSHNDIESANQLLKEHCTGEWLKGITSKWWSIQQFKERQTALNEAIDVHVDRKYTASIHVLLPQIEGIVTDWILSEHPEVPLPWRQESKTKKFRDLIFETPPTTYAYKRIFESALEFILEGPVLATFKKWADEIDESFPNRHIVEHGKYEEKLYTEVNSIKAFLLLDTIYHMLSRISQDE